MKKKIGILTALFSLVFLIGCIPSLHPLYTKDKMAYLDLLEGVWADQPARVHLLENPDKEALQREYILDAGEEGQSNPSVWDFSNNSDGGYELIYQDEDGVPAAFDVYMVKLGESYFLDLFPSTIKHDQETSLGFLKNDQNDLMAFHLLPVHTFAKLSVNGDAIQIDMLDPEFVDNLQADGQLDLKHETLSDGNIVLTAQPADLQQFVAKYADDRNLYLDDPIVLNRVD